MQKSIIFVSLGPGDAELVTIKAFKCLQQVSAIYCPATMSKENKMKSRAAKIVQDLGVDSKKIHLFHVPMNKERVKTIKDYESIAYKISTHFLNQEQSIAICAQGDASFYSSIHYISKWLESKQLPIQRIAGVPAFIAAGTLANIHIVKQEEHLHVIPGVCTYEELVGACTVGNTVVIMKPLQSEMIIKQVVKDFNHVTFHYFENVGMIDKSFYTQDKSLILNRKFPYFSLFIIK